MGWLSWLWLCIRDLGARDAAWAQALVEISSAWSFTDEVAELILDLRRRRYGARWTDTDETGPCQIVWNPLPHGLSESVPRNPAR